jgi:hypothetical protein
MEFLRIPSVWDYEQISMALGDNGFDVVKILTVLRDKGVLHLRACLYDELKLGGMANLRETWLTISRGSTRVLLKIAGRLLLSISVSKKKIICEALERFRDGALPASALAACGEPM